MKLLSALIFTLALSTSALANRAAVGTKAVYLITTPAGKFHSQEVVTAIHGDGTATVLSTSDQGQREEKRIEVANIESQVPVDNCSSIEGAENARITVLAGTFKTCRMRMPDNDIYFGNVPFLLVNLEAETLGTEIKMELESFKW